MLKTYSWGTLGIISDTRDQNWACSVHASYWDPSKGKNPTERAKRLHCWGGRGKRCSFLLPTYPQVRSSNLKLEDFSFPPPSPHAKLLRHPQNFLRAVKSQKSFLPLFTTDSQSRLHLNFLCHDTFPLGLKIWGTRAGYIQYSGQGACTHAHSRS